MKYIIHCLLKGSIITYHTTLVKEISEKFNLNITKEENLAPHFTLKYWFESKDIREVEKVIETFCKKHKRTRINVGGFSGFPYKVVFINIKLTKEAKKTFSEFIKDLKTIKWISWDKYDGENLHFHSTIAEECNEKYTEVLNFLKNKEEYFDCWFDNITILKEISRKEDNILEWGFHKNFRFNIL
jgi:2'-5' RNA ligase